MSQPLRTRTWFRPGQIVQIVGTREIATILSADEAERLGSQYAHDVANWDSAIVRLPSGEVGLWWSGNLVVYEPPADERWAGALADALERQDFDAAVIALVLVGLAIVVWGVVLWVGGYW